MSIATLTIDINAKLASLERDMGKAARIAEQNAQRMERAFGAAKAALGLISTGAAVTAITGMVKSSIDAADALSKMSQKVGISVESLSTLQHAANLSDLGMEEFGVGLKSLSTRMAQSAAGNKEAVASFRALGIEVKNADGSLRGTEDVLLDIADRFANTEDGALKTALAVKVFGDAGQKMIPLLNSGAAGIRSMQEEARAFGQQISTETARQAVAFNDNLTRLKASAEGLGLAMAEKALPGLNEITRAMTEAAREGGPLLALWVGLGGALSQLTFGTEADQARARVARLREELEQLEGAREKRAQKGRNWLVEQLVPSDTSEIDRRIAELRPKIQQAQAELDALINPKPDQGAFDKAADSLINRIWGNNNGIRAPQDEAAAKAAADRQKAIDNLVKGLEQEAATYGMTAEQIKLYELRQLGAGQADLKRAEGLAAAIAGNRDFEEAVKASEEAVKKENEEYQKWLKSMQDQADNIKNQIDPYRELNKEVELYVKLLNMGLLSMPEFEKAMELIRNKSKGMGEAGEQAKKNAEFAREMGLTFSSAFEDAVVQGKKLREVLQGIAQDIARILLRKTVTEPVGNAITSGIKALLSANGNVFLGGELMAFANGGVVGGPTVFPMRRGIGLMGEDGPEAIMPLKRGPDGKLGVAARIDGAGGVTNVYNIDARGAAPGVEQDILRALKATEDRAVARAVATTREQKLRGYR